MLTGSKIKTNTLQSAVDNKDLVNNMTFTGKNGENVFGMSQNEALKIYEKIVDQFGRVSKV
jgi:hypothetical protein